METINIVFSSDNNYAPYMGVAICSIFENKKEGYLIDIYVLDGGISEDNKNKLIILSKKYNFILNLIKIDESIFKNFKVKGHITLASYYRVIIPELISNIDKILYLDCDIIVIKDIYELYDTNIDNYYFAAVDEEEYVPGLKNKLGIPENEKYCNSGVMLMNSKKWREDNISRKIIDFSLNKQYLFFYHDQDAINGYLWSKWLNMNFNYNYTSGIMKIHKDSKDVLIVHFTKAKPWTYLCINPFQYKYFEYLNKTPWKDLKIENKNIKTILIRNIELLIMYLFPDYIIDKLIKMKRFLGIKFYY